MQVFLISSYIVISRKQGVGGYTLFALHNISNIL